MADAPETTIEVQPESVTEAASGSRTSNIEASQKALDASETAALEQILEGKTPVRDERGRFTSPKAKEPEPVPAVESESETDTTEPAADASADTADPEKEKALKAIRRTGADEEIIKSLSDAKIVEWGRHLLKVQAEQDRIGAEYGRLKESSKDTPPKVEDTGAPAVEPEIDLKDAIEPLVEAYGEEMREPMMKLAQALNGQFQKQMKPLVEAMRASAQEQLQHAALAARQSLEKEYPQLKDSNRHGEVADMMEMLYRAKPDKYGTIDTLMAAACKVCFADEQLAAMKTKLAQQHEERRKAAPSVTSSRNGVSPGRKVDRETEVLERIFADDLDGARAVASAR